MSEGPVRLLQHPEGREGGREGSYSRAMAVSMKKDGQ